VFLGVLAGTGLLLAAAISERTIGERRRAAAYAVGHVLATARDLTTAAAEILQAICKHLDWQIAGFWLVDRQNARLRCIAVAHIDGRQAHERFAQVTQATVLDGGIGLPGRVWATGKPAWIPNVLEDDNFPRVAAAREAGLHGAFAFPICLGEEVLGVIECFHETVVSPDHDLLRTMSTVGNQVGQFAARKREETSLRDAQRRTVAILDTALDAIIGMDHHGRITEFNAAAVRTFGYARENALGRELAHLLIPPTLRAQHRAGLQRFLETGVGPFIDRRVETTGYHADGHEFPVEVAITKVSGEVPPVFTGFVRDLTTRIEADREREDLLRREGVARREAESANRAKDEFLATLSHELRTPLNAIVGWTRMLLDGTLDEPSRRRALEVIDRNAHLQAQLVADILDVSRIITGGLRLQFRPVDLATVVGAALDVVRPAAEAKNVQLRSRLSGSETLVNGDPQRLQQVVWNLLVNAIKFTEAGGTVSIDVMATGLRSVRISVVDTGTGIRAEFLPHLFERFTQADGSSSRQHGGLGLGLAIVRHLVELHGGSVQASSAGVGQGSTFTVELPRLDEQTERQPARDGVYASEGNSSAAKPAMPLNGYRLLVVDDEADARDLLEALLMSAGAQVEAVATVADALQAIDVWQPDALLADLGMPGVDGYTLIAEVRQREAGRGRRLAAAAITAYASDRDRARALAAGFDTHVAKPISSTAVIDAVLAICPVRNSA
jgi:PAS domain S-box-containing protein